MAILNLPPSYVQARKINEEALQLLHSFPPQFDEAREKFKEASKKGYFPAIVDAQIIGFDEPYMPIGNDQATIRDYLKLQKMAVDEYIKDKNKIGNLIYLIVVDLQYRVFNTSSYPIEYMTRFVDYEIYCMREYGNEETKKVHNNSLLKDWELLFFNDWNNGMTAKHSDYLNESVFPLIMSLSQLKLNVFDGSMAVLRAGVVAKILENLYSFVSGV